MTTSPKIGAVLCDDLIFTSRITGTARALGLDMRSCRTPSSLEALAKTQPLACVILDVHFPGLDVAELVAALRQHGTSAIIGFGSHVSANILHGAREAGCDQVLPRSQFVEVLPTALGAWFGDDVTRESACGLAGPS